MEQELATLSNQRVQSVLADLEGAMQYLTKGMDTHPNRLDIIEEVAKNAKATQPGFGEVFARSNARPLPAASSGFGNSQPQSGFGAHPFRQPQNTGSAFGQPSSLSQNGGFGGNPTLGGANTGFGNPAFSQQNQNAFGQQPQFGQPNQMGQSAPFGQPTQQPNPTPFGQPSNNGNASFGVPSQPQQSTNTFGQASIPAQNGAFGTAPQQTANQAFGQPSALQNGNGGFGGVQQAAPAFGQPAPMAGSGGFNSQPQQQAPTGFGQPQQAIANNTFNTATPAAPGPQAFQNTIQPAAAPSNNFLPPTPFNPDISSYTTRDTSNTLLTWKNQPVSYINNTPCFRNPIDGSWQRIWFPDGPPPNPAQNGMMQGAEAPVGVEEAYRFLRENGRFREGVMPEVPPGAGMVRWDV